MKRIHWRLVVASVIALSLSVAGIHVLKAQQAAPSVKRNILLRQDLTIPGHEAIMALVEIPPGGSEGKHIHPAAEVFGYIIEGEVTQYVEGQPIKTLKAGDIIHVLPGQVHEGSNKGTTPVKISAVFVAEKGKPLTTQVP
ncbi:MAG TPA: cupin domain-containing protein [Thermoanaerobaculia bacterium]